MAKDREELLAQGPNQEPAAPSQRASRGQQRRRQHSVFQYITILFAAALVLLFYTFMMERRQFELQQEEDQANISNLQQQSVSATQTLNGILEENKALKDHIEQLEEDTALLERQLRELEDLLERQQSDADRAAQAMDWFWQINEAYVRNRTSLCKELIGSFETAGLKDALPRENTTGTERFSPAERYQEIYEKVM